MPISIARLNGLLAASAFCLVGGSLHAQEQCRIEKPAINGSEIKVGLHCQESAEVGTLIYPPGPLYVGVSLYTLEAELAGAEAEIVDDAGTPVDLPAQEIMRPSGATELVFPVAELGGSTHMLVAIWDQKNECPADHGGRCSAFGYTLGATDDLWFPFPVDAWPRPVCDVEKLAAAGFFDWAAGESDINEHAVPARLDTLFRTNFCWTRDPDRPGLGVSIRQWRVAPLPGP
jgi:hypothetical protein